MADLRIRCTQCKSPFPYTKEHLDTCVKDIHCGSCGHLYYSVERTARQSERKPKHDHIYGKWRHLTEALMSKPKPTQKQQSFRQWKVERISSGRYHIEKGEYGWDVLLRQPAGVRVLFEDVPTLVAAKKKVEEHIKKKP